MANLRDIINAATPGPWEWHQGDLHSGDGFVAYATVERRSNGFDEVIGISEADARYIAAYSPDHALLIEAVVEAAWGDCFDSHKFHGVELQKASLALTAYRKERDYE